MSAATHSVLVLASLVTAATAQIQAPCFETARGANLLMPNDSVAQALPLGFAFPGPGGLVTSIDVSSNGFVWLRPSANAACCSGNANAFVNDWPRIAPLWIDLDPSAAPPGGGVFYATFPASPGVPARAVVTWADVPEFLGGANFTFQLQLLATGEILFSYDANVGVFGNTALVGITEGNANQFGIANQNPVDFSPISAALPLDTFTNPTIHEEFVANFDLQSRSFAFLPNPFGGYRVVDRAACQTGFFRVYGNGCPTPPTVYEHFAAGTQDLVATSITFTPNGAGGYALTTGNSFGGSLTNVIQTADDLITGPYALPFNFPFPGGVTNAIDVDSNGCVILVSGSVPSSRTVADPAQFVADAASIAGHWMDLDPTSGGNVFVDVDSNNQAVHVSWIAVPEFNSTRQNTFQVSLFAGGAFRITLNNIGSIRRTSMVGFTIGGGSPDPGEVDLSAVLPFDTGPGGRMLRLRGAAGTRPTPGSPCSLELYDVDPASTFGLLVLGFANVVPPLDLSWLGMPRCEQHVTIDATMFFPLAGSVSPLAFPIPANNAFLGVTAFAQCGALLPGANTLGAHATNGLEIHVGL